MDLNISKGHAKIDVKLGKDSSLFWAAAKSPKLQTHLSKTTLEYLSTWEYLIVSGISSRPTERSFVLIYLNYVIFG